MLNFNVDINGDVHLTNIWRIESCVGHLRFVDEQGKETRIYKRNIKNVSITFPKGEEDGTAQNS